MARLTQVDLVGPSSLLHVRWSSSRSSGFDPQPTSTSFSFLSHSPRRTKLSLRLDGLLQEGDPKERRTHRPR